MSHRNSGDSMDLISAEATPPAVSSAGLEASIQALSDCYFSSSQTRLSCPKSAGSPLQHGEDDDEEESEEMENVWIMGVVVVRAGQKHDFSQERSKICNTDIT